MTSVTAIGVEFVVMRSNRQHSIGDGYAVPKVIGTIWIFKGQSLHIGCIPIYHFVEVNLTGIAYF